MCVFFIIIYIWYIFFLGGNSGTKPKTVVAVRLRGLVLLGTNGSSGYKMVGTNKKYKNILKLLTIFLNIDIICCKDINIITK